MEDTHQFSPPSDKQINPPNYPPSKKPLFIIFLIILVLVLIVVLVVIRTSGKKITISQTPKIPSIKSTVSPVNMVSPTVIARVSLSPITVGVENHLILYLRDGNIWSVKTDGTFLRQITRDADPQNFSYTNPSFKNENQIVFGNCSLLKYECVFKNKNLETGEEKIELEPKLYFNSFSWDKEGKLLAFIGGIKSGPSSLYFYENANMKKIFDFSQSLGRGSGLDDEVSLIFSPDSKYLIVINTATQPNKANDLTTLWVVDRNGNSVNKIQQSSAINALWTDNNTFIYKSTSGIYRKNIFGSEEKLADLSGYNFILTKDAKKLLYWDTSDKGLTTVFIYSLDSKSSQEVIKGLAYPKWTGDKEIIAVKTKPSEDSYFGFATDGLIVYNLETKEEHVLDSSSSIFQFIVQQ